MKDSKKPKRFDKINIAMYSHNERLNTYRLWVDRKYQNELQQLKTHLININYQHGSNHNYCYYLSLITQMERINFPGSLAHYRRYMAAYKIQQYWKKSRIKK